MRVEIINTGTELLLGNVINSHLAYFGQNLFPLGLRIERQVTVPDGDAIRIALEETFSRADIVLVTGGLGPTTDDITREIVAEMLGAELAYDAAVFAAIEARFAERKLTISERVKRQAMVPRGAQVLKNNFGTAPGLYLPPVSEVGSPHLFLLPGPPRELKPMFEQSVLPILKNIVPVSTVECRTFRIVGIGESNVEAAVGEQLLALGALELGYCARPGEVDVRCIGEADVLDQAEAIVRKAFDSNIVPLQPIEQTVVQTLKASGKKIAVAESCTGGLLANRITNVPGASEVFLGGFVSYDNEVKISALGVDPETLKAHGAVSREVAAQMAEGARARTGSDYALATTGIAGPGGGTPEKPVGTVFIALAGHGETVVQQHAIRSDRETFKTRAVQTALNLLQRSVQ